MKTNYLRSMLVILGVVLGIFGAPPARAQALAGDAMEILKKMSQFMAAQPNLTLLYDSDVEIVTPQLQKLQFNSSGTILLSRPNKLHATRIGGYADIEFFFDGNTAVLFGHNLNAFANLSAPGSVDQLIDRLRNEFGMNAPGADFLLTRSFEELTTDVIEAQHIGRGVIDGVECEHLAFRGAETDWQIWIEMGAQPIPHKYIITSKTLAGAPQYTLRLYGLKTNVAPRAEEFVFKAPSDAKQIDLNQLSALDEIPPGVTPTTLAR